jgi:RsiW-degrading membrane proteinase PrsW (M82 family)
MNVTGPNPPNLPAGPARNNRKWIRWTLGIAAVLFMGLLGLISLGLSFYSYGLALLIGMVMALLPLPIYLTLALWIDRYEKEPIWMLAGAFLWGATVAIFISGILNSLSAAIVGSFFGAGAGEIFAGSVSAPIVEESSKGLALFILFFWRKDEFDDVIDGIVYAAMVGLGFATVENFDYYARSFLQGGAQVALFTYVLRGVLSAFSHPLFTSMTGIGLGLSRQSSNTFVKFAAPVAGLLAAMFLHSLWNTSGIPLGLVSFFGVYLLVMIPVFIGVLAVIIFALRREGRIVRYYLTPELQSGLISQQEYQQLGSVFGRIGSSFRALSSGGFGGWRAHSRFAQTATELAFHRDRVSRDVTSVDAASREAAYVGLLRQLKGV